MRILEEQPKLKPLIDMLLETRRDEILQDMIDNDAEYIRLCDIRTEYSTKLLNAAIANGFEDLFHEYADAVIIHQIYELDKMYEVALDDGAKLFE